MSSTLHQPAALEVVAHLGSTGRQGGRAQASARQHGGGSPLSLRRALGGQPQRILKDFVLPATGNIGFFALFALFAFFGAAATRPAAAASPPAGPPAAAVRCCFCVTRDDNQRIYRNA